MRNDIERAAIEKEVLSTYCQVLDKLDDLIKNSFGTDIRKLEQLKTPIKKQGLQTMDIDTNEEEVSSYWIDEETGLLYRAVFKDFYFEYDNDSHELFASSYTIETEDDPVF